MKKVMICETEYNRVYLIEFREGNIKVLPLAQDDKEVKEILTRNKVIYLQDGNFVALNCIGDAYASIINEEVIEYARKNAIKWFTKQVNLAKENLEANELRLAQAINAKLEFKEEK